MTDDLDPAEPPGRPPIRRAILAVAVVIALGGLLAWGLHPRPPTQPSQQAAPPPPVSAPAVEAPPAPAPAAPPKVTRKPEPPEAAPVPPPTPVVRVTSDVDGAFVFVDRQFLGKTPLETTAVAAGRHQLNVSAEGYDGVSQQIDVPESGPTDLNVLLKVVRLNATVNVVHKHALGSCDGRLIATVDGLRYDTSNTDDAFMLPFNRIDVFSLDYRGKNLRVKERDGRTWNFTTREANADSLLVFSREVDRARAKLAQQGSKR